MFQPVKTSAVTLGAFRPCPHGHGLAYRGTLEKTGSAAAAALVGAAVRIANISETGRQQSTATLDVLDAEDNIVQDYSIPTSTPGTGGFPRPACSAPQRTVESAIRPSGERPTRAGARARRSPRTVITCARKGFTP